MVKSPNSGSNNSGENTPLFLEIRGRFFSVLIANLLLRTVSARHFGKNENAGFETKIPALAGIKT
jgi:hypothetical protein